MTPVSTLVSTSVPLPPICQPTQLHAEAATLLPLSPQHLSGLQQAAADGKLAQLWYTGVPTADGMAAEIERRLALQAAGSMLPFTVLDAQGEIAGMTSFMNIDALNRRVEIGSTWTAARVQRSALNTACKRLLLAHAFETLHCIAVEFRTHRFNTQSRRAIERLGAQFDGTLRNHSRAPNGTLRDTVVYSIIDSEWPVVRAHLDWQLTRPR